MSVFDAGQFSGEYGSPVGRKLWNVLNRDDVVARMETASDLGHPALAAVEEILLLELGATIIQDRFKQMAGRMTRQIMERRGFQHETSDVRLNSVPFYKASRYRRRDQTALFLFRSSGDPREICLTGTRKAEKIPTLQTGRWTFVNQVTSPLKARIGYDFDLKVAAAEVQRAGYYRHRIARMLRASSP